MILKAPIVLLENQYMMKLYIFKYWPMMNVYDSEVWFLTSNSSTHKLVEKDTLERDREIVISDPMYSTHATPTSKEASRSLF